MLGSQLKACFSPKLRGFRASLYLSTHKSHLAVSRPRNQQGGGPRADFALKAILTSYQAMRLEMELVRVDKKRTGGKDI
jgi:hypothetical protein